MQDGDISSIEFHTVLKKVEKYRRFKAETNLKLRWNRSQKNHEKNCLNKEERKAK